MTLALWLSIVRAVFLFFQQRAALPHFHSCRRSLQGTALSAEKSPLAEISSLGMSGGECRHPERERLLCAILKHIVSFLSLFPSFSPSTLRENPFLLAGIGCVAYPTPPHNLRLSTQTSLWEPSSGGTDISGKVLEALQITVCDAISRRPLRGTPSTFLFSPFFFVCSFLCVPLEK